MKAHRYNICFQTLNSPAFYAKSDIDYHFVESGHQRLQRFLGSIAKLMNIYIDFKIAIPPAVYKLGLIQLR